MDASPDPISIYHDEQHISQYLRTLLLSPCRWVTFTGELGDLELISAYPYSWEVQSLLTSGGDPTPLGGSFLVEFGGYISEDLPYDASADGLKAALEALPGVGRVDVDKTVLEHGKNEWLVTFRDLVGDLELIVVDGSDLTGTSAAIDATEVRMAVWAFRRRRTCPACLCRVSLENQFSWNYLFLEGGEITRRRNGYWNTETGLHPWIESTAVSHQCKVPTMEIYIILVGLRSRTTRYADILLKAWTPSPPP